MIHESAKQKSRSYFDSHRKSRFAQVGDWRHDYRYQLEEIGSIMPERLIDIGCGPGAFLCLVEEAYPSIQLNALDISPEMVQETRERRYQQMIALFEQWHDIFKVIPRHQRRVNQQNTLRILHAVFVDSHATYPRLLLERKSLRPSRTHIPSISSTVWFFVPTMIFSYFRLASFYIPDGSRNFHISS